MTQKLEFTLLPEGWYEEGAESDYMYPIHGTVTGWTDLPDWPKS